MLMQQRVYFNSKISNIAQSVTCVLTFDAANKLISVQADAPFTLPEQNPTATVVAQQANGSVEYVYDGNGRGLCIPSRFVHPGAFPGEVFFREGFCTHQSI